MPIYVVPDGCIVPTDEWIHDPLLCKKSVRKKFKFGHMKFGTYLNIKMPDGLINTISVSAHKQPGRPDWIRVSLDLYRSNFDLTKAGEQKLLDWYEPYLERHAMVDNVEGKLFASWWYGGRTMMSYTVHRSDVSSFAQLLIDTVSDPKNLVHCLAKYEVPTIHS